MENKDQVSLLDWRFKLGIFLFILTVLLLVIAVILLPTAKFTDKFDASCGNGFWAISNYGVHDLLFNWTVLDDKAIIAADTSHPFVQVFVALLFLIFLAPILFVLGATLVIRWWIKTRI